MRSSIILLFLCSCSHALLQHKGKDFIQCKLPIVVSLDDSVPEADVFTIKSALEYWNKELNHKMFVFMGRDYISFRPAAVKCVRISAVKKIDDIETKLAIIWPYPRTDGCMIGGMIDYIRRKIMNGEDLRLNHVMRHELGHALGLAHWKDGIMYYETPRKPYYIPRVALKQKCALIKAYKLKGIKECQSRSSR